MVSNINDSGGGDAVGEEPLASALSQGGGDAAGHLPHGDLLLGVDRHDGGEGDVVW